jgi:uncharacterized damage-inducible protein DinB
MFRSIDDFVTTWRHESVGTAAVLSRLTDASLDHRLHPDQRSLGEVAWHIVVSLPEILGKVGVGLEGPSKADAHPKAASQIHSIYVAVATAVPDAVDRAWSDDLVSRLEFYGAMVPRGEILAITLRHEIHHRGQLTAQMRPAGLMVPGVYGPSADD